MLVGSNRTWNIKVIASFLLVVALFAALVGASFAWLTDHTKAQHDEEFEATAISSYFGGGDGSTAENAYLIQNETHLYNLAWLQHIKKISPGTYFKLDNDIDMAGLLNGTTPGSGAIPPIGTADNAFQGHFDGGGYVISNLWVSTNPDDWKEHPDGMSYSSTHVGLFGALGAGAEVKNFNLDRVEITTSMNATVGIVCGLVKEGANISGVGVYNGILSFSASNLSITSNYSLIGEKAGKVFWEDMPSSSAGGNIIVDANDTESFSKNYAAGECDAVPNSADNAAFYVGKLTSYPANNYKNSTPKKEYVQNQQGNYELIDFVKNTDTGSKAQLYDLLFGDSFPDSKPDYIEFGGIPDMKNMVTVTGKNGFSTTIPQNCVWFKPLQNGTAAIAFLRTNQGGQIPPSMSIYKINRTNNTTLEEIGKVSLKDASNGQIVCYMCPVEKDVEYVIGNTNGGSAQGFVALILAGASNSNGDTTGKSGMISGVDYISTTDEIVGGTKHTQCNVLINISGTTTVSDNITYLATGTLPTETSAADPKVHCQNSSGLSVKDSIGDGVYSTETPSGGFKERDPGDTTAANN